MALALDGVFAALAAATEPTVVPFAGTTVRILPPMDWRQSAMTAARISDMDAWARLCLVNDLATDGDGKTTGCDDVAIWVAADPTNREVAKFIADYTEAAGQAPGK